MIAWLLPVLLAVFSFGTGASDDLFCYQPPSTWGGSSNSPLLPSLVLPINYNSVVRFSDRMLNQSAKITEFNYTDAFTIHKTFEGVESTWIVTDKSALKIEGQNCQGLDRKEAQSAYNISSNFVSFFNKTAGTLNEIISSVVSGTYNQSAPNGTTWNNGLPTVLWFGCVNAVPGDKDHKARPALQVQVEYVGEKWPSPPYAAGIKNPVIASIRLTAYDVINATSNTTKPEAKIIEDLSLNLVELELTDVASKLEHVQPARGIFCSNQASVPLPSRLPLRFEADIEYVNSQGGNTTVDSVELMYDGANKIVSFALDLNADNDIPYVQSPKLAKTESRVRVFLDFVSGYQYVLSKDGRICRSVSPINDDWSNSVVSTEGKLNLLDPTEAFFNISHQTDLYYGGRVKEEGVWYDVYLSQKHDNASQESIVAEFLFSNGSALAGATEPVIHSIVQYHNDATNKLIKWTSIRFNSFRNNTLIGTSWSKHTIFPCLNEGQSDNFFYLKVANASLPELKKIGFENVESALAEAVSKTTNISVLRVSQFLLKSVNTQLLACFILGEKTNGTKPAETQYLIPEKTVEEVRKLLNDTLISKQIVVSIVSDDFKTMSIGISGMGVISTSDETPQPPGDTGYTSGSMFILGLFMFIFGASVTVGGYVFYTKRQGIRGIAYQVFE